MRKATSVLLLAFCGASTVFGSAQKPSEVERHAGELLAQLEEIAMCHHAIKAARQDGISLDQNPYYRYILNSPQGRGANVYPIPKRCRTIETSWVLGYTQMGAESKALQDKTKHDMVQMTIADISADAQFMTVVINKMELEGEKAVFWENRDNHIPQ